MPISGAAGTAACKTGNGGNCSRTGAGGALGPADEEAAPAEDAPAAGAGLATGACSPGSNSASSPDKAGQDTSGSSLSEFHEVPERLQLPAKMLHPKDDPPTAMAAVLLLWVSPVRLPQLPLQGQLLSPLLLLPAAAAACLPCLPACLPACQPGLRPAGRPEGRSAYLRACLLPACHGLPRPAAACLLMLLRLFRLRLSLLPALPPAAATAAGGVAAFAAAAAAALAVTRLLHAVAPPLRRHISATSRGTDGILGGAPASPSRHPSFQCASSARQASPCGAVA